MKKSLNAFHLKVIAIIAMLINHIVHGFDVSKPFYIFGLVIGKLTFPIMAFLLLEGYKHTRNVKRYMGRLAIFWLISVVPFHLYFVYSPEYPLSNGIFTLFNNIFFTLLMGLMLIYFCENKKRRIPEIILVIIFALLTTFSDWGQIGVLIIYGFYKSKTQKSKAIFVPLISALLVTAILSPAYFSAASIADKSSVLIEILSFLGVLLNIPLLLAYNGERGPSTPLIKWGFYIFYPLHLMILYIISLLI